MTRFLGDALVDDIGWVEGALFIAPSDFSVLANSVVTRNAASDVSANTGASLAAVITICLNAGFMRRAKNLIAGLNADGTNPILGDAVIAKGIKITDISLHYLITGAALTVHTIRIDRIKFVNNVANAISAVLAVGANGLATAIQANPYTTKVPIVDPQDTSGYDNSDNSSLYVEIAATTQVAGAYRFYGMTVHYTCNLD